MEDLSKLKLINRLISASLIIQVLISKPVWVNSLREFPTAPVIPGLEWGIFGAILILLAIGGVIGLLFKPLNPPLIISVVALFGFLVLEDQSRLQPWLFLYALMLLTSVGIRGEQALANRLSSLLLLLSMSYFWSGAQKVNFFFGEEMFPWLAAFSGQESFFRAHPQAGYVVGILEAAAGLSLLFRPTRKVGAVVLLLMHAFILISLGPLGHDWNPVVWPWNLCFAAILVLLVWVPQKIKAPKFTFPTSGYTWVCLVLVGILPVLGLFGKWDHFLSGGFYSAVVPESTFYFHEQDRDKLPASSADFLLFYTDTQEEFVLLDQWALAHLGVPLYPEMRVKKQIGKKLCACIDQPESAGLRINHKHRFSGKSETIVLGCEEL